LGEYVIDSFVVMSEPIEVSCILNKIHSLQQNFAENNICNYSLPKHVGYVGGLVFISPSVRVLEPIELAKIVYPLYCAAGLEEAESVQAMKRFYSL
jgi:hypothetical protein